MSSRIKIFIIVFSLSLPFFWGINYLERNLSDFFFWHEISQNPQILTAQIALEERWREMKPIRNREIPDLEIQAKAAISVLIDGENKPSHLFVGEEGKERTLFEKEDDQKLPIASLTKLMTAWVVLEYYDLSKEIIISEEAANQYGDIRNLEEGRAFRVEYLLYPLLMESSNGAAFALANDYQGMEERVFVELMNQEAQKMRLNNTFFDNPSGLDSEDSKREMNYSTVGNLVKLTEKLLEKPLVWEILSVPKYSLYGPELINTNRFLLDDSTNWQEGIIGGKTGYTSQAGGCLLLVVKAPKNQGILINIVLGANGREDRFDQMRELVDWLDQAYKW